MRVIHVEGGVKNAVKVLRGVGNFYQKFPTKNLPRKTNSHRAQNIKKEPL